MAASVRACVLLTRTYTFTQTTILSNAKCVPSVLANAESVRGGRRTCRARPEWPKKHSNYLHHQELTHSNKAFLKELHASQYDVHTSPLRDEPWEPQEWTETTIRTGLLAIKIGIQPMWTSEGRKFTTTLLQVIDNHAIQYIPPEQFAHFPRCKPAWRRMGFGLQLVGALSSDPFRYTKSYNQLFVESGVPVKRRLTKFLVTPNAAVQPGTPLTVNHFNVGDYVDCQAKTVGHGFQGVVKRWGFKGGPGSHGPTKFKRRPGSTAGGGDKSAVWKGKKMPGHMGMEWRILRGLKIWRVNTEYNVLYVTGQNIPGPNHCYVRVMDSMLRHHVVARNEKPPRLPTWAPEYATDDQLAEDIYDDKLFQFSQPTILFDDPKSK